MSALDITPDNPRIVLIFSPARSVRESNLAAVREVMEQGIGVVIVTINQPARSLARHYQKNGVDTASLRFIDTVTKYAGGDAQEDMPEASSSAARTTSPASPSP